MKKRGVSLMLALVLALFLAPAPAMAGSLSNFQRVNAYTSGQFTDVPDGEWYSAGVQNAYEIDLMRGPSDNTFNPSGTLTLGEAVALAARIHSIYNTGSDSFQMGNPWYQVYVDYANAQGIPTGSGNYQSFVNRGDFAYIMAAALPAEALPAINSIEDGTIPDVPASSYIYNAVYTLYRAGVLTGSGASGRYEPNTTIDRASVATLVTRMADPGQRQSVTLSVQPSVTLYAADGSEITVLADEVAAYQAQGWYTYPVTTVYAAGGKSMLIAASELSDYQAQGWYAYPVTTVYAAGDKSMLIAASELSDYQAQGWYAYPVTTVYAAGDKSMLIAASELSDYQAQGWYTYPVTTVYAAGGKSMLIAASELSDYQAKGWSTEPVAASQPSQTTSPAVQQPSTSDSYVLNTNSKTFHRPDCVSAKKISSKNYATSNLSRAELIASGYKPCKNCNP